MATLYAIDPDITLASTLPGAFYRDAAAFERVKERVFARSWQWIGDIADVALPGSPSPREMLPGCLDEPLLLARDAAGTLRCMSNVCTHRGNLLVKTPCRGEEIRCGYHSRRFDLAGRMTFMPEFGDAKNFPAPSDHLPQVPFGTLGTQAFAAVAPAAPLAEFHHDPSRDRSFDIAAHWALYVENYLQGLHIPHVRPGLNQVLEADGYDYELHRHANLQFARARDGEQAFELPPSSPDFGQRVAACYYWIFSNLMLNFYPWGLSVNVVQPQAMDRTRVIFRSYVWDAGKLGDGAGSDLDQVEREDEAVVQQAQRGVQSRFYDCGRYSPGKERGVHHFHRLLCAFLGD